MHLHKVAKWFGYEVVKNIIGQIIMYRFAYSNNILSIYIYIYFNKEKLPVNVTRLCKCTKGLIKKITCTLV